VQKLHRKGGWRRQTPNGDHANGTSNGSSGVNGETAFND
jgi:hypothetical protein